MAQSAWYTRAQELNRELNTNLGTLVHLPWDVRELIYKNCIDEVLDWGIWDRDWEARFCLEGPPSPNLRGILLHYSLGACRHGGGLPKKCRTESRWCRRELTVTIYLDCGKHRRMVYYNGRSLFGFTRQWCRPRLVSTTMKDEFEKVFLSAPTFHLTCPCTFLNTIGSLSFEQQQYLCQIQIDVFNYYHRCHSQKVDWKKWVDIAQTLAPTLGSLNTIYFNVCRPADFKELIDDYIATNEMLRERHPPGGKGWPTSRWGPNTDAELFAEALRTLEVLSKAFRRRSERVNMVVLDQDNYLSEEGRTAFAKVLSEVE